MFRGVNGINIDVKGRIVIPTRYRERLQESRSCVVLTIDTEEKCLLLYPFAAWEDIESKLAELPSFNPQARRIQRLLIGHATEVELDNHGRILLPPLLREYAGLSKHAMLVGQGKKIRPWLSNSTSVAIQNTIPELQKGSAVMVIAEQPQHESLYSNYSVIASPTALWSVSMTRAGAARL